MAVIRSAQKQDFKILSKIFSLNVPKYFDKKELNDFKKYFNSKNLESYFIIESQGKVVGGGGYAYENMKTARICWLFIDPNYHGFGFGKKLVNYCIKILKNNRRLNVIEVETSNLTYKFYEKLNFKIVYIKKDYWPNNDDLYFMKIDLI
jgi:ribosomal protein S18 acetylase RimI-like enzyme